MKSKTRLKDKVNIITLGCSKNMVDSEVLSGQLRANNIAVVHESHQKDHNIVIVTPCGFLENAPASLLPPLLSPFSFPPPFSLSPFSFP
ncbi:MAG: hypothetical protein ACKO5C_02325, partial [Ferruginibacter sp.]